MAEPESSRLFELADSILAVARLMWAAKQDTDGWTPLDIAVMRYIDRHPGTTVGAAADATHMISSNFSRTLRNLEQRSLVRRSSDAGDARRVRLYPTDAARQNLRHLHELWGGMLGGIVADPADIDTTNSVLRQIENELIRRLSTPPTS